MKYVFPKSIYGGIAVSILICLVTLGCGEPETKSTSDFSKCKYGQPEAIFSDAVPQITSHSFKLHNKEGFETVRFDNGMAMELIQSGCDNIVQSFKFRLPGDHRQKNALEWVDEATTQLRYLGGLDAKYASLSFWGNEIEQRKSKIKLGATFDIQQGFKVKIDKVLSTSESILLVDLSQ